MRLALRSVFINKLVLRDNYEIYCAISGNSCDISELGGPPGSETRSQAFLGSTATSSKEMMTEESENSMPAPRWGSLEIGEEGESNRVHRTSMTCLSTSSGYKK